MRPPAYAYAKRHGFQLACLPGSFAGKLRTAPIVLLYLSPGYSPADVDDAKTDEGKDYRFRSWKGDEPFRDSGPGRVWLERRTKLFGDFETIKQHFAVLNIGAYHSKDVKSYSSLLALPSSRVSLTWAQDHLFAEAEAGKRVVILCGPPPIGVSTLAANIPELFLRRTSIAAAF